jgi:hypothetical protein
VEDEVHWNNPDSIFQLLDHPVHVGLLGDRARSGAILDSSTRVHQSERGQFEHTPHPTEVCGVPENNHALRTLEKVPDRFDPSNFHVLVCLMDATAIEEKRLATSVPKQIMALDEHEQKGNEHACHDAKPPW